MGATTHGKGKRVLKPVGEDVCQILDRLRRKVFNGQLDDSEGWQEGAFQDEARGRAYDQLCPSATRSSSKGGTGTLEWLATE